MWGSIPGCFLVGRSQIFRFLLFPEIPCCCRTLEGWTGVKVPVSLCSGVSCCRMRRSLGLPRHWVCVLTHIQPRCVVTTPKLGRFAIRSSLLRPLRQTGNNLQKSLLVYPKWDAELRDFRMLHNSLDLISLSRCLPPLSQKYPPRWGCQPQAC